MRLPQDVHLRPEVTGQILALLGPNGEGDVQHGVDHRVLLDSLHLGLPNLVNDRHEGFLPGVVLDDLDTL